MGLQASPSSLGASLMGAIASVRGLRADLLGLKASLKGLRCQLKLSEGWTAGSQVLSWCRGGPLRGVFGPAWGFEG